VACPKFDTLIPCGYNMADIGGQRAVGLAAAAALAAAASYAMYKVSLGVLMLSTPRSTACWQFK
jgi:hypothetical protein